MPKYKIVDPAMAERALTFLVEAYVRSPGLDCDAVRDALSYALPALGLNEGYPEREHDRRTKVNEVAATLRSFKAQAAALMQKQFLKDMSLADIIAKIESSSAAEFSTWLEERGIDV